MSRLSGTDTQVMLTYLTTVCLFLVTSLIFHHAVAEMNLSRVITEFSFGSYFLDIVQSLDSSFELAHERMFSILACSCR